MFARAARLFKHPLSLAAGAFTLMGLLSLVPDAQEADAGLPLLRLGLALVGILALALAALPLLKRLPTAAPRSGERLRCEEQLALGSKQRLVLLNVDGRRLLLAVQGEGISLLKDLGEELPQRESAPEFEFPSHEKLQSLLIERPKL